MSLLALKPSLVSSVAFDDIDPRGGKYGAEEYFRRVYEAHNREVENALWSFVLAGFSPFHGLGCVQETTDDLVTDARKLSTRFVISQNRGPFDTYLWS